MLDWIYLGYNRKWKKLLIYLPFFLGTDIIHRTSSEFVNCGVFHGNFGIIFQLKWFGILRYRWKSRFIRGTTQTRVLLFIRLPQKNNKYCNEVFYWSTKNRLVFLFVSHIYLLCVIWYRFQLNPCNSGKALGNLDLFAVTLFSQHNSWIGMEFAFFLFHQSEIIFLIPSNSSRNLF